MGDIKTDNIDRLYQLVQTAGLERKVGVLRFHELVLQISNVRHPKPSQEDQRIATLYSSTSQTSSPPDDVSNEIVSLIQLACRELYDLRCLKKRLEREIQALKSPNEENQETLQEKQRQLVQAGEKETSLKELGKIPALTAALKAAEQWDELHAQPELKTKISYAQQLLAGIQTDAIDGLFEMVKNVDLEKTVGTLQFGQMVRGLARKGNERAPIACQNEQDFDKLTQIVKTIVETANSASRELHTLQTQKKQLKSEIQAIKASIKQKEDKLKKHPNDPKFSSLPKDLGTLRTTLQIKKEQLQVQNDVANRLTSERKISMVTSVLKGIRKWQGLQYFPKLGASVVSAHKLIMTRKERFKEAFRRFFQMIRDAFASKELNEDGDEEKRLLALSAMGDSPDNASMSILQQSLSSIDRYKNPKNASERAFNALLHTCKKTLKEFSQRNEKVRTQPIVSSDPSKIDPTKKNQMDALDKKYDELERLEKNFSEYRILLEKARASGSNEEIAIAESEIQEKFGKSAEQIEEEISHFPEISERYKDLLEELGLG
jgi:predicted  nucleic acid-binding Zn-ribbon protein